MKYEDTNLPPNPLWEQAFAFGDSCLLADTAPGSVKDHRDYLMNYMVAPAHRLLSTCKDCTPESVAVALLGPFREVAGLADINENLFLRDALNDRTIDLCEAMTGSPKHAGNKRLQRDAARVRLAEGVSLIQNQLMGGPGDGGRHFPALRFLRTTFNMQSRADRAACEAPRLSIEYSSAQMEMKKRLLNSPQAQNYKP